MGYDKFLASLRVSSTNLLQNSIRFLLLCDIRGLQEKQSSVNLSLIFHNLKIAQKKKRYLEGENTMRLLHVADEEIYVTKNVFNARLREKRVNNFQ